MAERKKKPSRGLLDIIPEPAPEVPDSVQGGWLDAASYDPRMLSYAAGTGLRNMLEGTAALPGLLFDVARGGMQKIREMSPEGQRGSAASFDTTTVDALSEAARKAAEDPRAVARQVMDYGRGVLSSPSNVAQFLGENISPRIGARPTMAELDVYHGTPHRFPATEANPLGEFDASKIGTGEGAQAYGHGVYLAESPKVAQGYATGIPYRDFERKVAEVYNEFDSPDETMIALKEAGLSEAQMKVVKALEKDDWLGFDYPHQALRAALKEPKNFDLSNETKSALQNISSIYKADLPDEMIDRMLDWDKPLKEQPANVQKFFSVIYKPDDYLTDWLRQGDPEDIAKILQKEGIPGIKYLDAGSRGQGGSGTRNFVVFPGEEKKVKILSRE